MIDFHNHILPNVDDGANSIEESIEMLKCAEKQGITDVVNTVHFQHPKMDNKNVEYDYLKNEVAKLQDIVNKEKINIKIHLSAEVFYLPNLVEISSNPLVTLGKGKFMLVEFKSNIYPTGFEDEFFRLQSHGITPIVAHPERYRFVQNDLSLMEKWIDRGYIVQVDAGSILGFFGQKTKNICLKMLKNNFVHIIGSDAHNQKRRNFCIKDAYQSINKAFSNEYVDFLKNNISLVLNGQDILRKLNFSKKKKNIFCSLIKSNLSKFK